MMLYAEKLQIQQEVKRYSFDYSRGADLKVTQLWKLMWAISECCIGSSGSPLHEPLQKTFSSCEPKKEWPDAGLYIYNGRQI